MQQKIKFIVISTNEIRFNYKEQDFLLKTTSAGVYGMGQAVSLYLKKGFDNTYLKTIGWVKPDGGYGSQNKIDNYLKGIVTIDKIKSAAIEYIDKMG